MRYLYKITNKINSKCYIGQTNNIGARLNKHRRGASGFVGKIIKISGKENFDFVVLAECSDDLIDAMEIAAIKHFKCLAPDGYNLESGGCLSKSLHPETKKKMSEASKGNNHALGLKHSTATKKRMSEASKGNTHRTGKFCTEETKKRMSKAQKKKIVSEETCIKMSLSKMGNTYSKGAKRSKETRSKISLALKGKPRKPLSEEHKRKISLSVKEHLKPRTINEQKRKEGKDMEKFLTVSEVAQILRVAPDTVKRFIKSGRLDAVKIGRKYRISMSAIEKALKAYSIAIKATPEKKVK